MHARAIGIISEIAENAARRLGFSDEDALVKKDAIIEAIIDTFAEAYFEKFSYKRKAFKVIATAALITRPEECCVYDTKFSCTYKDYDRGGRYITDQVTSRNIFEIDNPEVDLSVGEWIDQLVSIIKYLCLSDHGYLECVKVNDTCIYEVKDKDEHTEDVNSKTAACLENIMKTLASLEERLINIDQRLIDVERINDIEETPGKCINLSSEDVKRIMENDGEDSPYPDKEEYPELYKITDKDENSPMKTLFKITKYL